MRGIRGLGASVKGNTSESVPAPREIYLNYTAGEASTPGEMYLKLYIWGRVKKEPGEMYSKLKRKYIWGSVRAKRNVFLCIHRSKRWRLQK